MKFPKKKPNHFKEKNKKDTRGVLSYEDLPLDEYEKEPEGNKLKLDKKKVLIAAGVLVVLVLLVVLYFSRGALFSCSGTSKGDEFSSVISGSTVDAGNFRLFGKGIAYASDTSFTLLSVEGEEIFKEQLKFLTPMLEVDKKAAIAYDSGGKDFALFSLSRLVTKGETQENIYLADITSDFSYAFITDVNGYNGKLSVYTPSGEVKYTYSFSDFYITSFALNNNATGAVVCGVTAENGREKSAIYLLDFSEEEPKALKTLTEDLVFDCDYLSGNSVCAVGSKGVYFLSKNGNDFTDMSYDHMTLTAYDINKDIGEITLSLSRSGDGRNCSLISVNSTGKVKATIMTEIKATSLSTYKDRISVIDDGNLYVYNQSGEKLLSEAIANNCKQVRMHSTSAQFILGIDEVYHITD